MTSPDIEADVKLSASTCLLLLAHHISDVSFQKILIQIGASYKNYNDMRNAIALIEQCGPSPEVRVKNSSFPKAETLLMSTLARYKKLQYPVWKNHEHGASADSPEIVLEVCQSQKDLQAALALDGEKLVRESRDLIVANAEKQLFACVNALAPLAKGIPGTKSWKEDVEVGLAASSC